MSLSARDLEWVLESDLLTGQLGSMWAARDRDELDIVGGYGLGLVGIVARPPNLPYIDAPVHARTALLAYVLGSTYRLRLRELDDLRAATYELRYGRG